MTIQLTHCDKCEYDITATLLPVRILLHVENDDEVCPTSSFYVPMKATEAVAKKYTVIMCPIGGDGRMEPEKPHTANQADSILEASSMFRRWMRDSGNDYVAADGYNQASAEVIRTENWDGISYGDYPWTCLLKRGPRGGVIVEDV